MPRTGLSRANFQVSDLEVDGIDFEVVKLFATVNLPDEGYYLRFEGDAQGNIVVYSVSHEVRVKLAWCRLEDLVASSSVYRTAILDKLVGLDEISQDDVKFLRPMIVRAFNRLIRGMYDTSLPLRQAFINSK